MPPAELPDATRVPVDSRGDILHLQNNVAAYAEEMLREHSLMKQQAGKPTEEKLNTKVHAVIDKWISEAFKMAGKNILVNGVAFDVAMSQSHDMEPLDQKLIDDVRKAEADFEEMALKVAEKRRHAPGYLGNLVSETVSSGSQAILAALEGQTVAEGMDEKEREILDRIVKAAPGAIPIADFESTLRVLSALKKDAPACQSRYERIVQLAQEALDAKAAPLNPLVSAFARERKSHATNRQQSLTAAAETMVGGVASLDAERERTETGAHRRAQAAAMRDARRRLDAPAVWLSYWDVDMSPASSFAIHIQPHPFLHPFAAVSVSRPKFISPLVRMGNTMATRRGSGDGRSASQSPTDTSPRLGPSRRSRSGSTLANNPTVLSRLDFTVPVDFGRLLPHGLYPSTGEGPTWDPLVDYDRVIVRGLQLERRLAPFYKGLDDLGDAHILPPLVPPVLSKPMARQVRSSSQSFVRSLPQRIRIPRVRRSSSTGFFRAVSMEEIVQSSSSREPGSSPADSPAPGHRRADSQSHLPSLGISAIASSPIRIPVTPAPTPSSNPERDSPPIHFRTARNRSISVIIARSSSRPVSPSAPSQEPTPSSPIVADYSSRASTVIDDDASDRDLSISEINLVDASVIRSDGNLHVSRSHGYPLLSSSPPASMCGAATLTNQRLVDKPFTVNDLYYQAVECPICFLYYPRNTNFTRCCRQPICTECFLQIRRAIPEPASPPSSAEPASCPYCMQRDFGVFYRPPLWSKLLQASSRLGFFGGFSDQGGDEAFSDRTGDSESDVDCDLLESLPFHVIKPTDSKDMHDELYAGGFENGSLQLQTIAEFWWGKDALFTSERPVSPDPMQDVTADDVHPELLRRSLAPPPTPPHPGSSRHVLARYGMGIRSATTRSHRRAATMDAPDLGDYTSLNDAMRTLGADLEELMLAEAIRRSILDEPATDATATSVSNEPALASIIGSTVPTGSHTVSADYRLDRALREVIVSAQAPSSSSSSPRQMASSSSSRIVSYSPASSRLRLGESGSTHMADPSQTTPEARETTTYSALGGRHFPPTAQ